MFKELFTSLVDVRPSLFRYAGEAAENDDSALADILAVNDVVNKTVSQYKKLFDAKVESEYHQNIFFLLNLLFISYLMAVKFFHPICSFD